MYKIMARSHDTVVARSHDRLWHGLPTVSRRRPQVSPRLTSAYGRPSVTPTAGSGDPRRTLSGQKSLKLWHGLPTVPPRRPQVSPAAHQRIWETFGHADGGVGRPAPNFKRTKIF